VRDKLVAPRPKYLANVSDEELLRLRPTAAPNIVPGAALATLDEVCLEALRAFLLSKARSKSAGEQAYVSTESALMRLGSTEPLDLAALKRDLAEQIRSATTFLDALTFAEARALSPAAGKQRALLVKTAELLTQGALRGHPYEPDLDQGARVGVQVDPLEYYAGLQQGKALAAIIQRRLQVLETALAALANTPGRPPGSHLDPFVMELASYWDHAVGRRPSWRKEILGKAVSEVTGPFVRYCHLALDCIPTRLRRGASVDSAIKRVSKDYVRRWASDRTESGASPNPPE